MIRVVLSGIFLAVAVFAAVMLCRGLISDKRAEETYASLAEMMSGIENTEDKVDAPSLTDSNAEAPAESSVNADTPASSQAEETREMIPDFEPLVEKNKDICGWIYMRNAKISYPVMWTPEEPEYYLRRNFYKESSRSGTPFVGEGCTVDSDCLLIYGHNMNNGSMFSALSNYAQQSYWVSNPTFWFNTLYEYREYQIFAAVNCRLSENEQEGFQYYQYSGDMTEDQFDELKTWLLTHAEYNTGIEPKYGDQILIVSTCGNNYSDERFFIAAFRIPDA